MNADQPATDETRSAAPSDSPASRRVFLQVTLCNVAGLGVASLMAFGRSDEVSLPTDLDDLVRFEWGYIVDTTRCIGWSRSRSTPSHATPTPVPVSTAPAGTGINRAARTAVTDRRRSVARADI